MILALDPEAAGGHLSVHVSDFASLRDLLAWRRTAARDLPRAPGLVFAKALRQLGGRGSAGFGGGIPHLRRLVVLAAWTSAEAFDGFRATSLGAALRDDVRFGWSVLAEAVATRGSHHGARPIRPAGTAGDDGPLAVLTLGRATPRTLGRFLLDGARLSDDVVGAPGMISAVSAGFPLTGNATFSLWETQQDMLAFAYGRRPGRHIATVRARPPILTEQLNARLRPLRIDGRWDPRTTLHPERLRRLANSAPETTKPG